MRKLNSKKPKIKIVSNGKQTKLWINGRHIEKVDLCDLHFYAEPFHTELEYREMKMIDGKFCVSDGEIVRETHELKF